MKTMTSTLVAAAALLVAGSSAYTAPTYLSCEFASPSGKPQIFNFALDASAGTFGVYVPATGSQRTAQGTFSDGKASLNEGSVAWEIDLGKGAIIRDKRMVGEKDSGACKPITAEESGFEE